MSNPPTAATMTISSSALPVLVMVSGAEQTRVPIMRTPFGIGRKTDKDLVIADPRVSRDHANIVMEQGDFVLIDLGSKHGTFVNGNKIDRHRLQKNDRMEFGAGDKVFVIFNPDRADTNAAREFLSQISAMPATPSGAASDLEKLKLFLEAARKLNTSGVVDEVLVTLIDATLRITHAERGFVYLRQDDASLRLVAARSAKGETLVDDKNISHSIVQDAVKGASEFLITDTSKSSNMAGRDSIVAFDLRTVICIPLRRTQFYEKKGEDGTPGSTEIMGVLYLDSRFASREITEVSNDILRAIATEAAALVENAKLVQTEAAARQMQQELAIAASIQQRLMTVTIPDVPYAGVRAKNLPCREIGGDFYDAVLTDHGLAIILADVCGKGVSAAILGSILQGMVYSQLQAGASTLVEIVAAANKFLCLKSVGEKYATMLVALLRPDGTLEFVNCGHVPPVLLQQGKPTRPSEGNLPVGLLPIAQYESATYKLNAGDRLIVVTDGVTEAEDVTGEFFGNERLESAAACDSPFDQIFRRVAEFCGPVPFNDDCTVLELTYKG